MAKAEWGTKRVCQSCGTKFYDFGRNPITCPSCAAVFDPETLLKSRRPRASAPAKPAKAAVVPAKDEDADDVAAADDDSDDLDDDDDDSVIEDTSDLGGDDDVAGVVSKDDDDD